MTSHSSSNSSDRSEPRPSVVQAGKGEKLLLGPRQAPIEIKIGRSHGSSRLAAFMEYIRPGDGIPIHFHENDDELIFIHSGQGIMALAEEDYPIEAGAVVFVPQGVWHGPRNTSLSNDLVMLAVFSPAGVEGYFREFSVAPGEEWAALTEAEATELERRYGIVYKGAEMGDV